MSFLFKAPENKDDASHDDVVIMQKLGYEQELYRGFNYIMNFAFTFASVSVIAGISSLFSYGLATGGPAVMVWGWVICSVFTTIVAACMAEICSVLPQAGSVYYWSGQLAGEKWGPLAAWTCGWFNLIGNAAGDASYAMGFGTVVAAAAAGGEHCAMADGSTSTSCDSAGLTNGQTVAIAICGITAMAGLNVIRIDKLGMYNIFAAFFMMIASFIMVVTSLSLAPELNTGSFVFTHSNNETGFSNFGYVCLIGLLTSLFSFCGYEAGAHMAEETRDARKAAPKGIIHSVLAGVVAGFVYMVCLLFSMQNLSNSENSITGNAVVQIFYDACGYKGGVALSSFLVIILFLAGTSSVTVTSRIAFAMVRDGAIPFATFLRPVNTYTKEPIRMVCVTYIFSCALILTQLGSSTAFAAVTSITTIGYQISYMIPILLRITVARNTFEKGPVNLGIFSTPLAIIAVIWLFVTSCFFIFPTQYPITSTDMNYACVMVGGLMIIVGIWWILDAHRWFKPKRFQSDKLSSMEGSSVSVQTEL